MRKTTHILYLLLLAVLGNTSLSFAQHGRANGPVTPVRIGSIILNLGAGPGVDYKGDSYGTPLGLKAAVEWGLWQAGPGVITLGGEIGNSFSSGGYYTDYHSHTIVAAVRSAWHYGWQVGGLDTYGGISAGIGFHHYQYTRDVNYSYSDVIPVPGIFIGASYFVTPSFGFNAEAGSDITQFQVGVVFKLK